MPIGALAGARTAERMYIHTRILVQLAIDARFTVV